MSGFIDRSAFIALQTGDTPSIRWEVSQIVSRVQPSRLIPGAADGGFRGHRLRRGSIPALRREQRGPVPEIATLRSTAWNPLGDLSATVAADIAL